VSTNSSGQASSTLTLGPNPGTNTVTASSGSLSGSPVTFTATGTASSPVPTALVLVSGNGQSGTVGQPLAAPFVVRVQDASGNPVAGVGVTFTVTAGGGTLSATQVSTNSSGQASSTLTLGPNPGTNTVTASSGSLSGSPVTFTATGSQAAQMSAWQLKGETGDTGVPGFNQWLKILYDPVSRQIFHYGVRAYSSSIYSTDVFFYNSGTNVWSRLGGTGSMSNLCVPSTASWPGDRHPVNQMAVDTKRNFLWLWGGVCQGVDPRDMYYLRLNANSSTDTWQRVTPSRLPPYFVGSGVYDPDDDVIFAFGNDGSSSGHYNWVYCSTIGNPTPGVLTAKQSAAGCTAADNWSEVTVQGGVQPTAGTNLPGLVYDTVNKKVILFGGYAPGPGAAASETWAYDVPTKTWTNRNPSPRPTFSGAPSSAGIIGTPLTYNPVDGKTYFQNPASTPATWTYDYPTNQWTMICNNCGGPPNSMTVAYDPSTNALVALAYGGPGVLQTWTATLAGAPPRSCDVNSDGSVNVVDVQVSVNQAVGVSACGTGDINGDSACNVVDIQRVINAALGGACQTGP